MRFFLILILLSVTLTSFAQEYKSTREERNFIVEGNNYYNSKDYKKAEECYNKALQENPMSYRALYNKALTQIRIGEDEDLKDQKLKEQYLSEGITSMQKIAELGAVDSQISSMANYNLGNIAFKSQDYKSAIEAYKQSLRLDPSSESARKNLRIAQKKLQQNNQNNQNKQDNQNKEQKGKEDKKEENKQQPHDSPQNNEQQKQQEQQPQDGEISQQSAEQILKAMENKENAARQRLQGQINKNQKNSNRQRPIKKW